MKHGKVLIVDDEPSVCAALLAALDDASFQVDAVGSADAALQTSGYDVMVVDKNLPDMSGLELMRLVRAKDAKMGFIMITGYASVESARACLELGIDAYIEKPFDDVFAVCARIGGVLERRLSGVSLPPTADHFGKVKDPLRRPTSTATRPLRAVVGVNLGEAFKPGSIEMIRSEQVARDVTVRAPDIVIFDETENLAALERSKNDAPYAVWAACVSRNPPLQMFTKLIDLGVRLLIDKPVVPAALDEKWARLVALAGARQR